jgi:hypothetical protein
MTHPHDRALEAAARALIDHDPSISGHHPIHIEYKLPIARAAVSAYQAAMPPPVSPELIAKLNKLASRLTQMGEYEAVDLIDTVVARLTPALAQEHRP